MKYSHYNTQISLTEQVSAIYNALSDKFVIIKNSIIDDLNFPANELLQKNNKLYYELLKAGVVVEGYFNEYEKIRNRSREIDKNPKTFQLMLNPTLDCNLKCWYCYEKHVKGSKFSPSTIENIKKFVSKIFDRYKDLEIFYLNFFGGEPLIGFTKTNQLIQYVSYKCKERNVKLEISFSSNGVLVNENIVVFLKLQSESISFQITLDGGKEYHDKTRFLQSKKGTYKTIVQNIRLLAQNKIFVILRINYTEENLHSVPSVLTDIKDWDEDCKSFVKLDFQQVWQDNHTKLEIDSLLESFSNAGFAVSSPNHNVDNLRFPCYADSLNQALINYNGDVYKCTARDFTTENRCGYLSESGDIVWTKNRPEERIEKKMQKETCINCSILPLCGGGCSQKCIEGCYGDDCTYGYDEKAKKEIVLNRFYNYFVRNHEASTDIQAVGKQ